MKIAYVTMAFPAKSETFACHDIRSLTLLAQHVEVYCLKRQSKDAGELAKQRGVGDVLVSSNSFFQSMFGLYLLVRYPRRAVWIVSLISRQLILKPVQYAKSLVLLPRSFAVFHAIAQKDFDVVHLFWGHFPSIVGLLVGEYLSGVQLTMFLGAYDLTMRYPLSTLAANYATTVFTHAAFNEKELADLGIAAPKTCVIYRGIDLELFNKSEVARDPHKIISSGRLVESKGFQFVIEAFERLLHKDEKFRLEIYGEGPFLPALRKIVEQLKIGRQVAFYGHVEQNRLIEVLKRAGFYVFLSTKDSERISNCVKEALAAGCFVITSKTPGIEELILPETSGVLVDVSDAQGIAEMIRSVTATFDQLGPLRQKSVDHLVQNFNVSTSMQKYVEQWNKCRENGQGTPQGKV